MKDLNYWATYTGSNNTSNETIDSLETLVSEKTKLFKLVEAIMNHLRSLDGTQRPSEITLCDFVSGIQLRLDELDDAFKSHLSPASREQNEKFIAQWDKLQQLIKQLNTVTLATNALNDTQPTAKPSWWGNSLSKWGQKSCLPTADVTEPRNSFIPVI